MKTSQLLVTAFFFAATALTGIAQAQGKHHRDPVEKYDKDGDGQATVDEILAARAAKFVEIDVNPTDGFVSFDEFKTWIQTRQTERFTKLDSDTNQLISKDEFLANRKLKKVELFTRVFALADTDGTEGLSADEFGVLGPQTGQIIYRFASLDTDSDGQVSQLEYLAAPFNHKRHH
jgi:hypothetical protein